MKQLAGEIQYLPLFSEVHLDLTQVMHLMWPGIVPYPYVPIAIHTVCVSICIQLVHTCICMAVPVVLLLLRMPLFSGSIVQITDYRDSFISSCCYRCRLGFLCTCLVSLIIICALIYRHPQLTALKAMLSCPKAAVYQL